MKMSEKRLLRITEVARILDQHETRVYQMIRAGLLPAVHLGRQVRIDELALEKWIENGGQQLPGKWKWKETK